MSNRITRRETDSVEKPDKQDSGNTENNNDFMIYPAKTTA